MDREHSAWSPSDDARFRDLVEDGVSPEKIATALKKTHEQLRRRGYDLGLPLKWFRKT